MDIPDDCLYEIMSHLDIRSIGRAKLVSKRWNAILDSKLTLKIVNRNGGNNTMLFHWASPYDQKLCEYLTNKLSIIDQDLYGSAYTLNLMIHTASRFNSHKIAKGVITLWRLWFNQDPSRFYYDYISFSFITLCCRMKYWEYLVHLILHDDLLDVEKSIKALSWVLNYCIAYEDMINLKRFLTLSKYSEITGTNINFCDAIYHNDRFKKAVQTNNVELVNLLIELEGHKGINYIDVIHHINNLEVFETVVHKIPEHIERIRKEKFG